MLQTLFVHLFYDTSAVALIMQIFMKYLAKFGIDRPTSMSVPLHQYV